VRNKFVSEIVLKVETVMIIHVKINIATRKLYATKIKIIARNTNVKWMVAKKKEQQIHIVYITTMSHAKDARKSDNTESTVINVWCKDTD